MSARMKTEPGPKFLHCSNLRLLKTPHRLGMVVCACNPNYWEGGGRRIVV
jgi:hypothetical protein